MCGAPASEQRVPRAGPGVHHQQPRGAAQPGQQARRDVHERQQHRAGQAVPLLPLQEEHPEANQGVCVCVCVCVCFS